jgi:microcystin-dependent protein
MTYIIPNQFRTRQDTIRLALLDENFSSVTAQINSLSAQITSLTTQITSLTTLLASSITAGTVMLFSANTAPAGWVKANGAALSRTTYASLFTNIGTTFGSGDGSTTFNIPDLRGEFLRSWDDSRGVDSGRSFGSAQAQDWKSFNMDNTRRASNDYTHGPQYMGKTTASYTGNLFTGYWSAPAAAIGYQWDSSEIRPRNMALLACIKF